MKSIFVLSFLLLSGCAPFDQQAFIDAFVTQTRTVAKAQNEPDEVPPTLNCVYMDPPNDWGGPRRLDCH